MLTASQPWTDSARWRTLACCSSLVVLVDLDGTLIEFASSPAEASLDDTAIQLLAQLVETRVRVVIVSGRPSAAIDAMRDLVPGAWWVAESGSWRWDAELCAEPAMNAPELDELELKLGDLVAVPGVLVERKSLSLCIHWRRVAESQRTKILPAIEAACDEWLEERSTFDRLDGVEMLEVRRRSEHKGIVVKWMRERIPDARMIAIGDDVTDEDMFAELGDGDASVGVGTRAPQADATAPNVRAVRAFLRWIVETRRGLDLPLPITPLQEAPPRTRHRLVVMSNRTPTSTRGRTREVGGLVSALEPALRHEHGIWLGWSGQERGHGSHVVYDASEQPARARFDLPSSITQRFYAGFCNSVLWPLFHGFPMRVRFTDGDWDAYVSANSRYARHAMEIAQHEAIIWVHDYHLLLVGRALRALGHRGRIGLFLHTPFPSAEVLETIPWGTAIVDAMLDFDLVGFQTQAYANNFLAASRSLKRTHEVDVGVFPVTIDPRPFREPTDDVPEVAALRATLGDRQVILGVDRLDYSKGIPERLVAFERLLDRFPRWRGKVMLLQISVPSRAEIPDYAELRQRVEGLVGRINGRFGEADWVPVRYLYRSYDQHVLAQLYRLADVALVTPLRDGMNLVAKEFIASQDPDKPGVLVLSQYAGVAQTFMSALITNPFHPEGLAADIDHALRMSRAERMQRYRMLDAALVAEGDAKAWAQRYLDRLAPRRLHPVE